MLTGCYQPERHHIAFLYRFYYAAGMTGGDDERGPGSSEPDRSAL